MFEIFFMLILIAELFFSHKATKGWVSKSDPLYKFKKFVNKMTNMKHDFSKLPRIVIKNIDIADWTFQEVHTELDLLIDEMGKLGNNEWEKLTQDVIIDYRIHIPPNYSQPLKRNVDNVNDNYDWYNELVNKPEKEALNIANSSGDELEESQEDSDHMMEIQLNNDGNDNKENNNNNNNNSPDTEDVKSSPDQSFIESEITPADSSLPSTRFDTYIGLWCEWSTQKFFLKDKILKQLKEIGNSKLKKLKWYVSIFQKKRTVPT